MIPLILRLKKENQRILAKAQDLIVETMLEVFDNVVLHGGTGIWRCYSGNRFSEDVDVYIDRNLGKIEEFFGLLVKRGFALEKKKIGENSIYSCFIFEKRFVRFEAVFKKVDAFFRDYEKTDGNFIPVLTLTISGFINEKVEAYIKRLKIRDLYDIFFLLHNLKDDSVRPALKKLIDFFKNPIDEPDLKLLILEGIVPGSKKMIEYIKDRYEHG